MMNAIFDRRGTYSCAVDAFIEVSTAELFLPHLSNLSVRNKFTALLFGARREKTDHCCVKSENPCGHTS